MFFIFGMPRSGTTLLAQCISAHNDIIIPHETDFIIPMAFILDRVSDQDIGRELIYKLIVNSKAHSSLAEFIDQQAIHNAVYSSDYHAAALLQSLYDEIASAASAKIAGDKSPNDLNFLRMLVKTGGLASNTKVIHIVRDVRDVMVSLQKTGWASDLDSYFPRFWSNQNLYLNCIRKHDESTYLLVRYEDFVNQPVEQLANAFRFLDVAPNEAVLSPTQRHSRYKDFGEEHANIYKPITPRQIGVYKEVLDKSILENYETQAQEALQTFGYQTCNSYS